MRTLLFLLMIGSAMGQATGNLTVSTTTAQARASINEFMKPCDDVLTFGNSSKAIKDIFPDECGEKADPPICYVGGIMQVGIEPKIPPCPPAEAPDVPAVEVKEEYFDTGRGTSYRAQTTCSDKTRILQHDEQTPPKFWCRKPVTK